MDLVVTDIVMPGLNGRQVVEKIRALYPAMRVLYISGYPEDVIAHKGVLDPGIDFLEKSSVHTDITRKVREVLDRPAARADQAPAAAEPAGGAGPKI
jgi:two-component system, cell cycle sensor histidine kinase and response regulator CckA